MYPEGIIDEVKVVFNKENVEASIESMSGNQYDNFGADKTSKSEILKVGNRDG